MVSEPQRGLSMHNLLSTKTALLFNINHVDARRRVHSSIICHHLPLHVTDRPLLPSGHAPRCLGIFPRVARL